MTWGAVGAAAVSTIGGAMLADGGGGGTQSMSKEPWAEAAPWLKQNLQTGQDLQSYYQNNPFNALQQAAYGQLFNQNNYVQGAIPSLLSQLSQPVGFDRNNPMARPAPIQFPQMGLLSASSNGSAPAGLLGDLNVTANPFRNGGIPAPASAPAAAANPSGIPQQALDAYEAWKARTGKNLTFDQANASGAFFKNYDENAGPGVGSY